jgi:DNA repair exonuclease SbcCD ATPase subunit
MVDFLSLTSKLKSLDIAGFKKKILGSEPIGDGIRSSYRIMSIAGETVALSETGLDPTEKVFHNKADFERLYVPEDLKDHQSELEELLIRMFPLTSVQSKQEILPPDDESEFNLVRESLYYRLSLLRDEILNDTSNSVDIREKLSRFDRLNKLIDSLESKFQKKRTQSYVAIVTTSSLSETQDPKLEMDDETVDDLLRKFGLLLLQSQHQLPGFKFPVSPNPIVRQVQSVLLADEEGFLDEVEKQGPIQQSIQDILDPDEKEKRILQSLKTIIKTKLEPLLESIQLDHAGGLDLSIDDESVPFEESLEGLLQTLFGLINELEENMNQATQVQDQMEAFIETVSQDKKECERQLALLQGELAKATKGAGDATSRQTSDRKAFEAGALKLRKEIDDKTAQLRMLQEQLTTSQEQLRLKETAAEAVATLTPEVERLREDIKVKERTIQALEAKDTELEPLRLRIADLEAKETLSKEEEKTLALTETQLQSVSEEKEKLEEQLRDYSETLDQLQTLVNRIPGPPPQQGLSPFEVLKQRIVSALPSTYLVPSILEIESDQTTYTCKFLEALLQLIQSYLDTQEGQELEGRLTEQLDSLQEGKSRDFLANTLLSILHYAKGDQSTDINTASVSLFSGQPQLKDLTTAADLVFFKGQSDLREKIQPFTVRLAGKDLPSYPVSFFLYLLALRDWVNCIDLSSRPGKCPIPERLQRPTLKCL